MKQTIHLTPRLSRTLILLAVLLVGLLALGGRLAQTALAWGPVIVVDDFNTGDFSLSGPSGNVAGLPASGAIGGVRDLLISDSGGGLVPTVMSLNTSNGYVNLALGDSTGNYNISWGNALFSATALNLDASNHDRVVVAISQAPAGGNMTMVLKSGLNNSFSTQSLAGAGDYTFLFSSLGLLNPADIDGIRITFDSGVPAGTTIQIDSIVIRSEPCPAGKYDNGSGCVDADPGYYVPEAGATEQIACPMGTYQPYAGSVSCFLADPGHFVSVIAAAAQSECPLGTYSPFFGAISCLPADPGHFVDAPAAVAQIACAPGFYQPYAGSVSCLVADAGHFVDAPAAVAQIACAPGFYQPYAGSVSCLAADAGHFVDAPAAVAQIACAPGFYQPYAGSVSCLAADAGHFVAVPAAVAQNECPLGTYQPNSGSASCNLADPGYFVDTTGAVEQTMCPAGTTSAAGASECTPAGYTFTGFFAPVDMAALNVVKAGQAIPVKFSLGGDYGLDILAAGYPSSVAVTCDNNVPLDVVEETVTAGSSSLSYNPDTDEYTYVWKTIKSWANSCRTLTVMLDDGSVHQATFKFTR